MELEAARRKIEELRATNEELRGKTQDKAKLMPPPANKAKTQRVETGKNNIEDSEKPLKRSDVCELMSEGIAAAMMELRRELGHMLQKEMTSVEDNKRELARQEKEKEEQKGGESRLPEGRDKDRWSEVVGRKAIREAKRREAKDSQVVGSTAWIGARKTLAVDKVQGSKGGTTQKQEAVAVRRNVYPQPPRSAAVCVTAAREGGTNIKEVMTKIRKEVDLANIGVQIWDTRKTMTGGTLLGQGPGKEGAGKDTGGKNRESSVGNGGESDGAEVSQTRGR